VSPQDISDRSGHHPGTANEFRLPCRNIARRVDYAAGFLLRPHSPSTAFFRPRSGFRSFRLRHPARQHASLPPAITSTWVTDSGSGNHPGRRRGSCVSHALRSTLHVAIQCYLEEPLPYVRLFRIATVSIGNDLSFPTISGDRT